MADRRLVAASAIVSFLGVAFGAFGAHALKLEGKDLDVWHTATLYHLVHGVAALIMAQMRYERVGWIFIGGIALFSGSLYVLVLSGVKALGAVTPLGGLLFLAGWANLTIQSLKAPASSEG